MQLAGRRKRGEAIQELGGSTVTVEKRSNSLSPFGRFLLAGLLLVGGVAQAEDRRPNIIVLMTDDAGALLRVVYDA